MSAKHHDNCRFDGKVICICPDNFDPAREERELIAKWLESHRWFESAARIRRGDHRK